MGVEHNGMIIIVIFPHLPNIIVCVVICEAVIHHHHHVIWRKFSIRLEVTKGAHDEDSFGITGLPFVRSPVILGALLPAVLSFVGTCAVLEIPAGYTDLLWSLVLLFAFLTIVL